MSEAVPLPDLAPLRDWFTSYCNSFRTPDREVQRNFDLKEEHTRNVCRDALLIAQGMGPRFEMLAEIAALCHDLGRFPQFRDHHTFKDSDSLNHAHLSAQLMKQHQLLEFLPGEERACIEIAVRMHNAFQVPDGLPAVTTDLLRLLRDADKLDIWRVFIEYFNAPADQRASGAGLGFPDLPGCSAEPLAAVTAGKMVQLSTLKSLNDFKLLQVSWIYDINYPATLRLIRERSVLERFRAMLPQDGEVLDVMAQVGRYLERRLRESAHFPQQ
ncbi:HD domain-containing protein [Geomonas nitrogeniifigens]|uniref:HD domain-containing protein n=1 Tax=Geomonas diazotrophica TaxID=2843197 RepID=A0ABX8JFP8_9BACT|nr:HD domain-containing protein [Geomonas nitrogeniifigens]QWV96583.1 HD domain-containing protein [Geomonas nitrogeniifigens]QXE85685.1 HD domain-containing protein [Geomonas nitrogeniifigens]